MKNDVNVTQLSDLAEKPMVDFERIHSIMKMTKVSDFKKEDLRQIQTFLRILAHSKSFGFAAHSMLEKLSLPSRAALKEIKKNPQFAEGLTFFLEAPPSRWCDCLGSTSPGDLEYPCEVTIEKVEVKDNFYYGMSKSGDLEVGWAIEDFLKVATLIS